MPFRAPSQREVTPGGKGRFPGFDVLSEVDRWDDVTAGLVLARLDPPLDLAFFGEHERSIANALFDRLLAQDDEPKIPILPLVDRRLAVGETDGWVYEDMPEDGEAWHMTLSYLERDAFETYGRAFSELEAFEQGALVRKVQEAEQWHDLRGPHVWSLWTRYACAAFYSHPWAWNEIGFGGPAYPRGYKALGVDKREGWELKDSVDADPVIWAQLRESAEKSHSSATGEGRKS